MDLRSSRVALLSLVVGTALAGCASDNATPGRQTYGPSGHTFSIAFPSPPKSQANTKGLLTGLPPGSKAYGYEVSPDANVFNVAAAPVPRPPTFAVVVVITRTAMTAKSFVQQLSALPGFKPYDTSGLTGFRFVGSEKSPINTGSRISDPTASEGALFLDRGSAIYVVEVITAHRAEAQAFRR